MLTPHTIVALATPAGRGGIGIIRLSGSKALAIARQIFRPLNGDAPWPAKPRLLTLGWAHDGADQPLDQVLAVYFPAPHSYTTEDVVEIHAHGAPAVLRHMEKLCLQYGAHPAQAGEFTLRAFLGGRLDLSQAEAISQLIQARSEQEGSLAALNLQGGLSQRLKPLRGSLLAATAQVEAWLDFPEEQEQVHAKDFMRELETNLLQPVTKLLHERERGRVRREGALIMLCGRPNVGKSSLFNALLGRERALVSHHPGTTRDGLQDEAIINGVVCRLQDSAGLGREAAESGQAGEELARLGQETTRRALAEADLLLLLLDSSCSLTREDEEILRLTESYPRLLLASKSDLPAAWPLLPEFIPISVRQGDMRLLEQAIFASLLKDGGEAATGQVVVSARQSERLQEISHGLHKIKDLLHGDCPPWELIAWELQHCLANLAALDGLGAPDEVLEEIFTTFCLGK